jgi:hypothetical protein
VGWYDMMPFDPSISVDLDAIQPEDSPTGLSFGLSFPQDGMTISPAAVSGLQACTDGQIGNDNSVQCPAAGRVETVFDNNPQAGQTVERTDTFTIGCTPRLGGFSPSFNAEAVSPTGGAFSPPVVAINRPDGQQYVAGVNAGMPLGTVSGPVALTGPYKGAPYGLAVSARANAGPFDLGTVVVRQAIYVDSTDARLTVVSDPLPVMLKGVPVRLRSVRVDIDRPGFTINPTSCAPRQIVDQAGIRSVKVALPLPLALDPENAVSDTLCECEEGQKAEPNCPKSSVVGSAKAVTPLLNRPLSGPVYFVKNVRIEEGHPGRQRQRLQTHKTASNSLAPVPGGCERDRLVS